MYQTDVLVLGSGIAGCTAALALAREGVRVTVVTAASELRASNSFHEQEGIAYRGEGDSPELFARDLKQAANGHCCSRAVEQFVQEGPRLVEELLINQLHVDFEKEFGDTLLLDQPEGHSVKRVLRSRDLTGRYILDLMLKQLNNHPDIEVLTCTSAVDLITLAEHSTRTADHYKKPSCVGAYLLDQSTGEVKPCLAKETLLATGGIAGLFIHSTSLFGGYGDGIAMAHRAGARVLDLGCIEFHPLVFYAPNDGRFLLNDELRLSGGELLSHQGAPFMERYHEAGSQAPAAEAARAIYLEMVSTGADHLWLDLTRCNQVELAERYPSTFQHCQAKGCDPAKDLIPIVPAAHRCAGGVVVDKAGQTTIQRLRAIGEVSCTGLHGMHRLPAVSMLEGMVWAQAATRDICKQIQRFAYYFPEVAPWQGGDEIADPILVQQDWSSLKQAMWQYVGPNRSLQRLRRVANLLRDLQLDAETASHRCRPDSSLLTLRNGIATALLMTEALS